MRGVNISSTMGWKRILLLTFLHSFSRTLTILAFSYFPISLASPLLSFEGFSGLSSLDQVARWWVDDMKLDGLKFLAELVRQITRWKILPTVFQSYRRCKKSVSHFYCKRMARRKVDRPRWSATSLSIVLFKVTRSYLGMNGVYIFTGIIFSYPSSPFSSGEVMHYGRTTVGWLEGDLRLDVYYQLLIAYILGIRFWLLYDGRVRFMIIVFEILQSIMTCLVYFTEFLPSRSKSAVLFRVPSPFNVSRSIRYCNTSSLSIYTPTQ